MSELLVDDSQVVLDGAHGEQFLSPEAVDARFSELTQQLEEFPIDPEVGGNTRHDQQTWQPYRSGLLHKGLVPPRKPKGGLHVYIFERRIPVPKRERSYARTSMAESFQCRLFYI